MKIWISRIFRIKLIRKRSPRSFRPFPSAGRHYDALGRRTCKAVRLHDKTVATRFLWQGYRLLQEQKQNGARQTYLYDPNDIWSPLARLDQPVAGTAADILWFNTDLNGAPLEVTDEEGHLRWAGHYGTFGEVKYQSTRSFDVRQDRSLIQQPLRYAGQYADKETGLHYNLFRHYDPGVGRFTVQDPIGLAGGINLYQYAPNPLNWIDPWGLSFLEIVGDSVQATGKKF